MKTHHGGRLFLVAAVLSAAAVLLIALFVALEVRSVAAGPHADPLKPNPGHEWSEVELPVGTWPGLNADTLDGKDSTVFAEKNACWMTAGNTTADGDFLGTTNSQPLVIKTNNTEAMRIDTAGQVGIGMLDPQDPQELLHIKYFGGNPGIRLENTHTANSVLNGNTWDLLSGTYTYDGGPGYTNRFGIVDATHNDYVAFTVMPASEGGYVGIGTPDPKELLHINWGGSDPGIRLENSHSSGNTWDLVSGTYEHGGGDGHTDDFGIWNATNQFLALTVDSVGNVGIGTPDPQATLDVNGYARLLKYWVQPVDCSATYDGSIALTASYRLCVCKGADSQWVEANTGTTPCDWYP